jgi:hypothetical protein
VQISRRALLGLAVLGVAGCGKHRHPRAAPQPIVVPDAAALTTARRLEQMLLASYDERLAHASPRHRPRLQVERAIHATHLSALKATPKAGAHPTAVHNLEHALRTSARTLRAQANAATDGSNAALFASIAASHEASAT